MLSTDGSPCGLRTRQRKNSDHLGLDLQRHAWRRRVPTRSLDRFGRGSATNVETPVADRLQSIKNPSGDPFQLQPMNVPADTTIDMLAPGRKTWLRHSWKSTRLLNYKKFEPRLLLTRLRLLRIESLLIGARHIGAGDLWSLPSGIFCCITFGDETAQII